MRAYHPTGIADSDYSHIREDGLWYQHWQAGYHDILKRGYRQPKYKTTVLAELHSPMTPDFLHGGARDVPFLVSTRTKKVIRESGLSGVRFSRVEVAKVATKGRLRRHARSGEPEDQILKVKDKSSEIVPPLLHAAYVTGRLEIIPDYPSGRCPDTGYVTPYALPRSANMPDLWRPTINGRTFAAWIYCSERFSDVVVEHSLSNIDFEPFESQMQRFRDSIQSSITKGA